MKQLLIVIGLVTISTLSAQNLVQYPKISMYSTSTMVGSGSSLPIAAMDMKIEKEENTNSPYSITSGPKKARPGDNKDPGLPLGDALLPLLILAAGYMLFVARKRPVR